MTDDWWMIITIRTRKSGMLHQHYFYIYKLSSIFPLLLSPPGNKITDAGVLLYTPRQHQDIVPRRQQRRHSVHLCFPREWKIQVKNKGTEVNKRKKSGKRDGQMVLPPPDLIPAQFSSESLCYQADLNLQIHIRSASKGALTVPSTVCQRDQLFCHWT